MTEMRSLAWANALGARTVARSLRAGGVQHVVASPGSRNTPLVLACESMSEIQMHTVLDERSAGFFALGLAKASRAPVALLCTSGSAAGHYLPAVIEAYNTRQPLVLLTADRPARLQGGGAPQTIDQHRMFGQFTPGFVDLGDPQAQNAPRRARALLAQAVARSRRSGPVQINAPYDEPLWAPEIPDIPGDVPNPVQWIETCPGVSERSVSRIVARLQRTSRGLVVCGPLDMPGDTGLATAVVELGRKLGWPVLAEATSQIRYGRHDLAGVVATYDALLRDDAFAQGAIPDIVLRIGRTPTSKALLQWLANQGPDRTVLVDAYGDWHDPTFGADAMIVADPQAWVNKACELLHTREDSDYRRFWLRADDAATGALATECDQGFWQGTIARTLIQMLPDRSVLHVANSMPIRDVDAYTPVLAKHLQVHANRGANGIDGTLACAWGEATAHRPKPTVLLCGDLAFLHDSGSLASLRGTDANLTVVVVNNRGGRIFEQLPIAAHHALESRFVTPQGADLGALSAAWELPYKSVTTAEDLGQSLRKGVATPGVQVIEAVVDPGENRERQQLAWRAVALAMERQRAREQAL